MSKKTLVIILSVCLLFVMLVVPTVLARYSENINMAKFSVGIDGTNVPESITVITPPNKVEYKHGDAFVPDGMVVEVTYTDGTKEIITGYKIVNGDSLTSDGQDSVKLEYTENSITIETEVSIIVNKVPESIKITKEPDKTEYNPGEDFDRTGMVVEISYTDGSKGTVTEYDVPNGEGIVKDQTSVTISYTDEKVGVTLEAIQEITIADSVAPAITLNVPDVTYSKTYTVSGSVSDSESGVKSVTVNGVEAVINDSSWTAEVTLDGLSIEVVATDNANNVSQQSVVYEVFTVTGSNKYEMGYTDDIVDYNIPATFVYDGVYRKVTTLGGYMYPDKSKCAFVSNNILETITIPDSVVTVGNFAISECINLRYVTIGNEVQSLGNIYHCPSIVSFTVEDGNEYYITIDGIIFDKTMSTIVRYPSAKVTAGDYSIPDTVSSIRSYAFMDSTSLKSVDLKEIASIGSHAFHNSGLVEVTIPGTVSKIEGGSFSNCSDLEVIVIEEGVTQIGVAFTTLPKLYSVSIPTSVSRIEMGAFNFNGAPITLYSTSTGVEYQSNNIPTSVADTYVTTAPDLTDPEVTISSDSGRSPDVNDPMFSSSKTYTITYGSSDSGSGVRETIVTHNGSDLVLSGSVTNATRSISLQEGINTVTVSATDNAGNTAETTTYILYSTTSPYVVYTSINSSNIEEGFFTTITYPGNGATSHTFKFDIYANAPLSSESTISAYNSDGTSSEVAISTISNVVFDGTPQKVAEVEYLIESDVGNSKYNFQLSISDVCSNLLSTNIMVNVYYDTLAPVIYQVCDQSSGVSSATNILGYTQDSPYLVSNVDENGIWEFGANVLDDTLNYMSVTNKTNGETAVITNSLTNSDGYHYFDSDENLSLSEGVNELKFTARDICGNETVVTTWVEWVVPVPTAYLYNDGSIVFCNDQWSADNSKTLTTTYTGWDTEQYSTGKQPWYDHMADITSVTIEDGVSPSSMDNWFYGATNLSTVYLGEGITAVGDSMFFNCKMLTGDIVIPESVVIIGANSFGLTSITGVHIGSHVELIGDEAFYGTDISGVLVIPDSVVTLEHHAFYRTSIVGVSFGSGVQTIGYRAFYCCYDLSEPVVFPDSLVTIEYEAFSGCWSLDEITFGSNVTSIGSDAFHNGLSDPIVTTIHGGNDLVWNYDWVGDNRDVTFVNALSSTLSAFSLQSSNESGVDTAVNYGTSVFEIAQGELGYSEGENGYTKYGARYNMPYEDWCAIFAMWVLDESEVPSINYAADCATWVSNAKQGGIFRVVNSYVPAQGDIVVFDQDLNGVADHVGFVNRLDLSTNKLYTVEGNYSDMVANVERAFNSSVLGYMVISTEGFEQTVSVPVASSMKVEEDSTEVTEDTEEVIGETEESMEEATEFSEGIKESSEVSTESTTDPIEETEPATNPTEDTQSVEDYIESTVPVGTEESTKSSSDVEGLESGDEVEGSTSPSESSEEGTALTEVDESTKETEQVESAKFASSEISESSTEPTVAPTESVETAEPFKESVFMKSTECKSDGDSSVGE